MRNGSNILNHADFQTGALQSADGSLTAGARAFNQTFNLLQTMHHGLLGGHIGSLLGGKGVLLREPLKPCAPALDHEMALPALSVIVIIVLLKVD